MKLSIFYFAIAGVLPVALETDYPIILSFKETKDSTLTVKYSKSIYDSNTSMETYVVRQKDVEKYIIYNNDTVYLNPLEMAKPKCNLDSWLRENFLIPKQYVSYLPAAFCMLMVDSTGAIQERGFWNSPTKDSYGLEFERLIRKLNIPFEAARVSGKAVRSCFYFCMIAPGGRIRIINH